MNPVPVKRSKHIWAVIIMTLAMAVYFSWAVLDALLILSAQGVANVYAAAYAPAAIVIGVFLVAAFAVYRGYRWSLFLYQLGTVLGGLQLLLFVPGLWQAGALILRSNSFGTIEWQLLLSILIPIFLFAIPLYGAIVVYKKIYSVRTASEGNPS